MFTIGVGVAGFSLGGGKLELNQAPGSNSGIWDHAGFSWLTNLHGLTVDTVVGFQIVLPSGRVLNVDGKQNPDLFWGLKGGLNNFVRHSPAALIPGMISQLRLGRSDKDHTQVVPPDRCVGMYSYTLKAYQK